jgi:hypothetical protein
MAGELGHGEEELGHGEEELGRGGEGLVDGCDRACMARNSSAMEERGSQTAGAGRRIEVDDGQSSGGRQPEQVAGAVVVGAGAGKEVVVVGGG